MKRKCITIAISNQKGGVGKTSSTACIGAALALQGKRILLVDLDAQQNLTFTLTQNEDPETSIYDALVKDKPLPIVPEKSRFGSGITGFGKSRDRHGYYDGKRGHPQIPFGRTKGEVRLHPYGLFSFSRYRNNQCAGGSG